jgi:hypothetical protein
MTDVAILKTILIYAAFTLAAAIIPTLIGLWFLRKRIREHRHVRNLVPKNPQQRELPLEVTRPLVGRR